jgi:16S rRNA (guanine527-N7)-methyltransferase
MEMETVVSPAFMRGLAQLGLLEQAKSEDELLKSAEHSALYQSFMLYRHELLDWNTRFNLTAIKDPEEVLIKHFLDSLSLLRAYDQPQAHLLDIGSGAGFPGLPLKIARPQWRVTLLEATGKRVTFLRHIVEVLALKDVEVVQGRAEDLGHNARYRGHYDVVTARAVASIGTLLEYSAPYCRRNGLIILPKKGELAEEIAQGKRAALQVGSTFYRDVAVDIEGLDDGRRFLVWQQRKPCPPQFPRSGSVIAKKPLGG